MEFEDDEYDLYPLVIYRGFDLSDLSDKEATDLKDKIDIVYKDMTMIKDFCSEFLSSLESGEYCLRQEGCLNPSAYNKIMEQSINSYGKKKGSRIAYLILGKPEELPQKIVMAKAKAMIISYYRQFEDDENEPVHPSDFENSDLYKTIKKLSDGKNLFPDFDFY